MTLTDSPLTGQDAVDALLALLDIRTVDETTFDGRSPRMSPIRVFGGQVAAQALIAAGRTVDPERIVHSLHAYFIRPGDPAQAIRYKVEIVRDGRSFSTRRVTASQQGRIIFSMDASFQLKEGGLEHQSPMPLNVPPPETLPRLSDFMKPYAERSGLWKAVQMPQPIDLRYVGDPGWMPVGTRHAEPKLRVWMRADGVLPDDPLIHACALTFASDLTLLDTVLSVHGEVFGPGGFGGATLDHALWFHRPFRADNWILFDCTSPSASGGRGLAAGSFFSADGLHIASAVQEGLLRRA